MGSVDVIGLSLSVPAVLLLTKADKSMSKNKTLSDNYQVILILHVNIN